MGRRFRRGGEREEEEEEEEEEVEFKRYWKMFAYSFPGRVLSANAYTDPAAERETTPTGGYATVCLSVSVMHAQPRKLRHTLSDVADKC